ncbi:MAG TPA: Lsr2 family protein [Propionibacteriaceae bacterium]
MARKQIVKLIDDLDGNEIKEGDGETVTFTYRGSEYEIDLGTANARRLDDALTPFVSAARRIGGKRTSSSATGTATIDRSQLTAMRTWARDHGYKVSDRGRISQEIQEAYHASR